MTDNVNNNKLYIYCAYQLIGVNVVVDKKYVCPPVVFTPFRFLVHDHPPIRTTIQVRKYENIRDYKCSVHWEYSEMKILNVSLLIIDIT